MASRAERDAIAIIATDLDGTLLDSHGEVSTYTQRTFERLRMAGWLIVVTTARPLRDVLCIPGLSRSAALVCGNGTLVHDPQTGADIHRNYMSLDTVCQAASRLRSAYPRSKFGGEVNPDLLLERGFDLPPLAAPATKLVDRLEDVLDERGVAKLIVQMPGRSAEDYVEGIREWLPRTLEVTYSSQGFCEITAPGGHKACALAFLVHRWGYDARNVVAFGDMPNDIPMLSWSGKSVAVANAHDSVLAIAESITTSNDDDGVARFLNDLLMCG